VAIQKIRLGAPSEVRKQGRGRFALPRGSGAAPPSKRDSDKSPAARTEPIALELAADREGDARALASMRESRGKQVGEGFASVHGGEDHRNVTHVKLCRRMHASLLARHAQRPLGVS
jgi:hypothetical protein